MPGTAYRGATGSIAYVKPNCKISLPPAALDSLSHDEPRSQTGVYVELTGPWVFIAQRD